MTTKKWPEKLTNKVVVKSSSKSPNHYIEGRKVLSYGKSWTDRKAPRDYFKGQLWQECHCGMEPVYIPTGLCEDCINTQYGLDIEVCYAYLEEIKTDENANT